MRLRKKETEALLLLAAFVIGGFLIIGLLGIVLQLLPYIAIISVVIVLFVLGLKHGPRIVTEWVREIRKNRYFSSAEFIARKAYIAKLVSDHNDIANYVQAIHANGKFEVGFSSTGANAHLASYQNSSSHNYRRDRHVANFGAKNVHNCSLQVVNSAKKSPIQYLIKYFNIEANEITLQKLEELGENISRLENAITSVTNRESKITSTLNPPSFILEYFYGEFIKQIELELPSVKVPYPTYRFEYVSAGGNSSQKSIVKLKTPTIDVLMETLNEKIHFRKSAAGQRALMTSKLREFIKRRDNYACKFCGVSLTDEPNLLLEVDHIVPVSKGGLSTEENLQALCWRCNRSKSDKIS